MSWLRPRRKSVDIVQQKNETQKPLQCPGTINEGRYHQYKQTDAEGVDDQCLDVQENTLKHQILEDAQTETEEHNDGDPEQVNDLQAVELIMDTKENDSLTSLSNSISTSSFDQVPNSHHEIKGSDCNTEVNEEDDENRDFFSDQNMNDIKFKKNLNKPRHSLDSQIELLSGYKKAHGMKVCSLESLGEEENDTEQPELNGLPQKKKSISWASDLETIHEFQKIKGRRLSLSSIFKKY
jgi:hypothetical protein